MSHQERGAHATNERTRARFAAVAARNRALAAVIPGHEGLEDSKKARRPFDNPMVDTLEEFGSGRAGKAIPPEAEAGATVQDEQGKLNVRTAPETCVKALRRRVDGRVSDLREHLTTAGGRHAIWIAPQTIRAVLPVARPKHAAKILLDDASAYGLGSRVRVWGRGAPVVADIVDVEDDGDLCTIAPVGEEPEPGALIEVEGRHPLNLNTASRAAIAAALEGLALRWSLTEDRVTRGEADALAARIAGRTWKTIEDFETLLDDAVSLRLVSDKDARAILLNAILPSHKDLGGTGTVPFAFRSWNCVSVEARGSQLTPAKNVGARLDLREIVEAAPAGPLAARVKSQGDFERMLRIRLGNGVVTGPAIVAAGEDPSDDRERGAWVMPVTALDERGVAWEIHHFGPHPDGHSLSKGAWSPGGHPALVIPDGEVCWESGVVELWARPGKGDFTIFEAGDAEWSDRILFSYEGNGSAGGPFLRLSVKDATLERGWSEIVHPVALLPDRWYHFGAHWKQTRSGGLMMTLDGLPVGEYRVETPSGLQRHVRLAGALGESATTIVADASVDGFPQTGAIEIGDEVIEYASRSGTRFMGCVRGARGTFPGKAHPAGAGITVWGYASRLTRATFQYTIPGFDYPPCRWDTLTPGGGTLTYGFGTFADTVTVIVSPPVDPPKIGLRVGDTVIQVPAGAAKGFPEKGWLLLGAAMPEVVYYGKRNDTMFMDVKRAVFCKERDFFYGEPVSLFGFHVSANDDYPSPTILMIDGEMFGPMQRIGNDGWVSIVGQGPTGDAPLPLLRDAVWLEHLKDGVPHEDGAKVLPTFPLADLKAGRGDTITLIQQDAWLREEHEIRGAVWFQTFAAAPFGLLSPNSRSTPPFLLVGLDDHTLHEYAPDGQYTRALKFPSGELGAVVPLNVACGASSQPSGPPDMRGWIDEVRFHSRPRDDIRLAAGVHPGQVTIRLAGVPKGTPPWIPEDGGAVLVGDEVVGFARYDAGTMTLEKCVRGYLGTSASGHAQGARVFPLSFLTITALRQGIAAGGCDLSVNTAGFPRGGFALVGQELLGWTRSEPGRLLAFPGCDLRGAFGTFAAPHAPDELVYAFPYRYADRFTLASDDAELHWFGAAMRASGAKWTSLSWEERRPVASLDVQVWARFNARPRWTELGKGEKQRLGMKMFDDPRGGSLGNVTADQIELRVMFEWEDGAYARGEWKEAAIVTGLRVEYEQPTVVHEHQEK